MHAARRPAVVARDVAALEAAVAHVREARLRRQHRLGGIAHAGAHARPSAVPRFRSGSLPSKKRGSTLAIECASHSTRDAVHALQALELGRKRVVVRPPVRARGARRSRPRRARRPGGTAAPVERCRSARGRSCPARGRGWCRRAGGSGRSRSASSAAPACSRRARARRRRARQMPVGVGAHQRARRHAARDAVGDVGAGMRERDQQRDVAFGQGAGV